MNAQDLAESFMAEFDVGEEHMQVVMEELKDALESGSDMKRQCRIDSVFRFSRESVWLSINSQR